jgi:DNA (cytosine-5)-methyltransferase 1
LGAADGGGFVSRPVLLDLFCGAGGCSVGYERAGFDVTGIDREAHADYPFPIVVADAMEVLAAPALLASFDVIHASPPCPRYSTATPEANRDAHPDLVEPVRDALREWGGVYVIENVPGAPLDNPTLYCGGAFGLAAQCRDGQRRQLQRHRLFESNAPLMSPGCGCDARQKIGVYGDGGGGSRTSKAKGGGYKGHPEESRAAMGIDWMRNRKDLSDAIPPAYTEHIGRQLLDHLANKEAA